MPRVPKLKSADRVGFDNPSRTTSQSVGSGYTEVGKGLQILSERLSKTDEAKDRAQKILDEKEYGEDFEAEMIRLNGVIKDGKYAPDKKPTEILQKGADDWIAANKRNYKANRHRALDTVSQKILNDQMRVTDRDRRTNETKELNKSWTRAASTLRKNIQDTPEKWMDHIMKFSKPVITSKKMVGVRPDYIDDYVGRVVKGALVSTSVGFARKGKVDEAVAVIEKHGDRFTNAEKDKHIASIYALSEHRETLTHTRDTRLLAKQNRQKAARQQIFSDFIGIQLSNIDLDKPGAREKLLGVKALVHDEQFRAFADSSFINKIDKLTKVKFDSLSAYNVNDLLLTLVDNPTKDEFLAEMRRVRALGMNEKDTHKMLAIAKSLGNISKEDPAMITAEVNVIKSRFQQKGSYFARKFGGDNGVMLNMKMTEAIAKAHRLRNEGFVSSAYEARQVVLAEYLDGSHLARDMMTNIPDKLQKDAAGLQRAQLLWEARVRSARGSGKPIPLSIVNSTRIELQERLDIANGKEYIDNLNLDDDRKSKFLEILQSNDIVPALKSKPKANFDSNIPLRPPVDVPFYRQKVDNDTKAVDLNSIKKATTTTVIKTGIRISPESVDKLNKLLEQEKGTR